MKSQLRKIVTKAATKLGLGVLREPITYNRDGLATQHNCDFINDPRFAEKLIKPANKRVRGKAATSSGARLYAAGRRDKGKSLPGDFVECGVNKGGLARTVVQYVNFPSLPKKFYLLDTFHGLSEKYISPEERAHGIRPGGYEECYEAVKKTFSGFNVEIIRGTVPDTLSAVKAERVAYLSIDMNCMEPEIAAAEFFWDKLSSGAVIVLDDYGWNPHISQKRAFDVFAAARGVQVLALPTGQGMIIKP